jgi:hypothetical protein
LRLSRFLGPIVGPISAFALLTALAGPASAHAGGSTGISLSAERLPPGGALEIIGTDFSPGETLAIQLLGPTKGWALPSVTTGPDGHFAVVLSVPSDATPGFYTLDAISTSGIIQRETFQVDLAAPAPALTPTLAGPAGAAAPVGPVDLGPSAWAPFVVIVFVGAVFVALAVRRRPRSPARP